MGELDVQYREECYRRNVVRQVDSDIDIMRKILSDTTNPATYKKLTHAIAKLDAISRSEYGPASEIVIATDVDGGYEPSEYFDESIPFDELTDCQKRVCYDVFEKHARGEQSLTLVVGGAGTGKTQCIKTIVSKLRKAGKHVGLCATSGAAAVLINDDCSWLVWNEDRSQSEKCKD